MENSQPGPSPWDLLTRLWPKKYKKIKMYSTAVPEKTLAMHYAILNTLLI